MKKLSVLLSGAAGYGAKYLDAILNTEEGKSLFELAGAVSLKSAELEAALAPHGIPIYESADEFYKNHQADLAVISSPYFLHREQVETCLANHSHILCEKPLCTSLYEAMQIKRMAEESGRMVFIGFQLSFSGAIRRFKQDIMSGLFGKPLLMKAIVHYARGDNYFARNSWAGKKYLPDGRLCLDSPLHNAVAHHLNNMLFLIGDAPDRAAYPSTVQAELYRSNMNITNFDTFALRAKAQNGTDILFYSSHSLANKEYIGPICVYRFEKATAFHEHIAMHDSFYVAFDDGSSKQYYAHRHQYQMQKLFDCAYAINGGEKPWSSVEAAIPQVVCTLGASLSHPVADIPQDLITYTGKPDPAQSRGATGVLPKVEGLQELLLDCYDKLKLPSEMENAPAWAVAGRTVELAEIMALQSDKSGGRF
ncbi:MAG: Gfo/Idh/MocA family oxidoreductase [Oscillospiraceae bacterium]|nr:Gfo/Idh/MocA family oxidoreductase [Oscillospiraceae bacterium]